MSVKTGNVTGAGTDANVFITLIGSHGDSGERRLDDDAAKNPAPKTRDKFEKNQTDKFWIKSADLGELKQLRIWHDSSGIGNIA